MNEEKPVSEAPATKAEAPAETTTPAAPAEAPAETIAPATPAENKAAEPKKKKTGLIVCIIVIILALCGAGVAAYFLIFKKDPNAIMTDAIVSLITDDTNKIGIDGEVSISGMGSLKLKGQFADGQGDADVKVSATIPGLGSISAGANAIVKGTDFYIKASGLTDILKMAGMPSYMLSSFKGIDDQWYYAEMSDITSNATASISTTKCDIKDLSDKNVRQKIADAYRSNSFVIASNYDGNDIEKNGTDLYLIHIDVDKLNAFGKAVNSVVASSTSCEVSEPEELDKNAITLNDFYMGVKDNKISRIFTKQSQSGIEIKVDFNFTYPTNVDVKTPNDYEKIEKLIQQLAPLFSGMSTSGYTPSYNIYDDIEDEDDGYDDYDFDYDLEDYDLTDEEYEMIMKYLYEQ